MGRGKGREKGINHKKHKRLKNAGGEIFNHGFHGWERMGEARELGIGGRAQGHKGTKGEKLTTDGHGSPSILIMVVILIVILILIEKFHLPNYEWFDHDQDHDKPQHLLHLSPLITRH